MYPELASFLGAVAIVALALGAVILYGLVIRPRLTGRDEPDAVAQEIATAEHEAADRRLEALGASEQERAEALAHESPIDRALAVRRLLRRRGR